MPGNSDVTNMFVESSEPYNGSGHINVNSGDQFHLVIQADFSNQTPEFKNIYFQNDQTLNDVLIYETDQGPPEVIHFNNHVDDLLM